MQQNTFETQKESFKMFLILEVFLSVEVGKYDESMKQNVIRGD